MVFCSVEMVFVSDCTDRIAVGARRSGREFVRGTRLAQPAQHLEQFTLDLAMSGHTSPVGVDIQTEYLAVLRRALHVATRASDCRRTIHYRRGLLSEALQLGGD